MARTKNKTKEKNLGGKPPLYNPATHPTIAKQCCRHFGDSQKELAKALEVHANTITVWKNQFPEFKDAVTEGSLEYDCGPITNALRECCLGSEYDEIKRDFIEVVVNGEKIHCTERKVMVDLEGAIVSGLLETDVVIGEVASKSKQLKAPIEKKSGRTKGKAAKDQEGEKKKAAAPKLTAATVLVEGEKVTVTHKKRLPESTAIFFWLQNRKSKLWKNVQRQIVETTSTTNHKHDHIHRMVKIDKEENERYRRLIHDAGTRDRAGVGSDNGRAGHGSSLPESSGVHSATLAPGRN